MVTHAGAQNWAGRKAEQADHKMHQAIDAVPTPPRPHTCVLLCRHPAQMPQCSAPPTSAVLPHWLS